MRARREETMKTWPSIWCLLIRDWCLGDHEDLAINLVFAKETWSKVGKTGHFGQLLQRLALLRVVRLQAQAHASVILRACMHTQP